MDPVRASKLLSYVLRHDLSMIGITLDQHGWVPVRVLLDGMRRNGHRLTRAELLELVVTSDKQRFAPSTPLRTGSAPTKVTRSMSTSVLPRPLRPQCSSTARPNPTSRLSWPLDSTRVTGTPCISRPTGPQRGRWVPGGVVRWSWRWTQRYLAVDPDQSR